MAGNTLVTASKPDHIPIIIQLLFSHYSVCFILYSSFPKRTIFSSFFLLFFLIIIILFIIIIVAKKAIYLLIGDINI